jgi:hypothetical protein
MALIEEDREVEAQVVMNPVAALVNRLVPRRISECYHSVL